MSTYEEKCAAVARMDEERKALCAKIQARHDKKKEPEPKKPVKLRSTKKQLKEAGFKYITL